MAFMPRGSRPPLEARQAGDTGLKASGYKAQVPLQLKVGDSCLPQANIFSPFFIFKCRALLDSLVFSLWMEQWV